MSRGRPKKKPIVPMSCIVQDVRDSRLDYYIPASVARQLYAEGKLIYYPDLKAYGRLSQ